MSRLRLTIDSNLDDVFLVGLAVNKICEYLRMDAIESSQVELCAVEAVTNAIRHAYDNREGNQVSVSLAVLNNRLELEVSDTGRPMPAAQVERLSHGSSVFDFDPADRASLPEGGMGLQIIHEVMDEVTYKTAGQTNSLQLIRLLDAVGHSAEAKVQEAKQV